MESEKDFLLRLGYQSFDKLLPNEDAHWIEIFRSNEADYQYLVSICNHDSYQYIACSTFVDYLEFMHKYLPTIETMNKLSSANGIYNKP